MMMSEKRYREFIRSSKQSNVYWTESAITDFTEELSRLMQKNGVSRAEFAKRIGHSQAYVTKVLRGNVNFTLATMTKLARALGVVVRVHLASDKVIVKWEDLPAEPLTAFVFPEVVYDEKHVIEEVPKRVTRRFYSSSAATESIQQTIAGIH
jgi:transcriptional regulator with XRE-family HTH domain